MVVPFVSRECHAEGRTQSPLPRLVCLPGLAAKLTSKRAPPSFSAIGGAAPCSKGHEGRVRQGRGQRVEGRSVAKMIANPILVVCKTGQTAGQAAAALIKKGAQDVAVLKGGMGQWKTDNYPVTTQ